MSVLRFDGVEVADPPVLGGLSFALEPGQTAIRCGGTGRARILRTALGMDPPFAGSVRLLGADPAALEPAALRALRARCSLVLHAGELVSNTSVQINVALPLLYHEPIEESEVDGRVQEALGAVGLAGAGGLRPADLGGDERRLVALARALALRPALLLLQDPFEGLDERAADLAAGVISRMVEGGCAALVTTAAARPESVWEGRLLALPGARVLPRSKVASGP